MRQGVSSLHTCAVAAHGTGLLVGGRSVRRGFGITRPGTALEPRHSALEPRHSALQAGVEGLGLGIAQSSALPPGCLGLSCALWSVNGHMPVHVGRVGIEAAWFTFSRGFSFLKCQQIKESISEV